MYLRGYMDANVYINEMMSLLFYYIWQVWEESDSSDEEEGGAKAMEAVSAESDESDDGKIWLADATGVRAIDPHIVTVESSSQMECIG